MPSAEGSETEPADGSGSEPARIALVWLPGLARSTNVSVEAIARRLAYALDRRAKTAAARFSVDERIEEVDRGQAGRSRRATVLRTVDDQKSPAIDIFELDYAASLLRPHLEATAFRRWLEATWVAIRSFLLAAATFRHRRAKTLIEKLQLVFIALWLILLSSYVWLLLVAVLAAIETLTGLEISALFAAPVRWLFGLWGREPPSGEAISQLVGGLLVIVLGASATVPALRARIEETAALMISAFAYLRVGRQRRVLTGRLADLIEHIAEEGGTYRRIDLVGNSFGSLLALDALFPHDAKPEPRFGMIRGLVTIGCPYDALRAIWPSYASGRSALPDAPATWINIYEPLDVFGSNFRDDREHGPTTVPIAGSGASGGKVPTNQVFRSGQDHAQLSLADVLVLRGLRAHAQYWGDQEEAENTCFNELVEELYRDDPVLA